MSKKTPKLSTSSTSTSLIVVGTKVGVIFTKLMNMSLLLNTFKLKERLVAPSYKILNNKPMLMFVPLKKTDSKFNMYVCVVAATIICI